ncbi:MAG: IS110 family transposase [Cyclobacteriaceae bacterium]
MIKLQKNVSRSKLMEVVANLPKCLIGMESCGGSNFWAREFKKMGHEVKIMAAQFVKPYVKSNKNDMADAEAICEAVSRPNMRFVPIKQIEHQDIQCVHRVRARLIKSRTALVNEIRGLLLEYGIAIPKSVSQLRNHIPEILESSENQLMSMSRQVFSELYEEFQTLDKRIDKSNDQISRIHSTHPVCRRLSKIPGVGILTATAILAALPEPTTFKSGRQVSAWLGLVPKQHSSGGKDRLLGISKRGDVYLRWLLIYGARASIRWIDKKEDWRSIWLKDLIDRRGKNRAAVALANKNARMIWAILTKEVEYDVTA